MNLRFTFRGTPFDVPFGDGEERLVSLFDILKELFDVRKETCTIIYHGKKVSPFVKARDMVLGPQEDHPNPNHAASPSQHQDDINSKNVDEEMNYASEAAVPEKPSEVEEINGGAGCIVESGTMIVDASSSTLAPSSFSSSSPRPAQVALPVVQQLPSFVKILITGSSEKDIDFFQKAKADPLVKGFAALERDEKARRRRERKLAKESGGWGGSKMHAEFRFSKITAEYKYNTPTPFEAEKLLTKLAHDPAIVKIMTEEKLHVGLLTEMSPAEAQARMQMEGKDGDLLGFNENAGARIVLRLRTDDTKGFRPYHDLVNTLIHELVHNTFGPHDDKFWNLFRNYKKRYDQFHDYYSRNGQSLMGRGGAAANVDSDSEGEKPQRLGGAALESVAGGISMAGSGREDGTFTPRNRREQLAEIAEKRMKLLASSSPSPQVGRGAGANNTTSDRREVEVDQEQLQAGGAGAAAPAAPGAVAGNGRMDVVLDDASKNVVSVQEISDHEMMSYQHPERCPCGVCEPISRPVMEPVVPMDVCKEAGTAPAASDGNLAERVTERTAAASLLPLDSAPTTQRPNAAEQVMNKLPDGQQHPEDDDEPMEEQEHDQHRPEEPVFDEAEWADLLGFEGAQLLISVRKNLQKLKQQKGASSSEHLLTLIQRVCSNLVQHPTEEKYRQLPLSNAKIRALVDNAASAAILDAMGFRREPDRFFIAPARVDPGKLIMLRDIIAQFVVVPPTATSAPPSTVMVPATGGGGAVQ
ncbi:unnamed protein product [Amoebophrya sp. A120]|nr:unnamed protein product [Amoebophrya sp. A120]|eukprot:GSA120T00018334001.1